MQAEVIVVTSDSLELFTGAQRQIATYLDEMKETASKEGSLQVVVNERQVDRFLYTALKLNSMILQYSRMASVVLVSLPAPPVNHPSYFYMEYMDLLVENIPRLLVVSGYRREVVTLFA